jgi:homoserine O-acetyltransferase
MLTYRTPEEFAERFRGGLDVEDSLGVSAPGAYLRARGEAFLEVMSPGRFLSLCGSIDRHQVDPGRITAPTLLIGARSDQLVPPSQMQSLAAGLGGEAQLHLLDCLYGHDMFLKEADKLGLLVRLFLEAGQ